MESFTTRIMSHGSVAIIPLTIDIVVSVCMGIFGEALGKYVAKKLRLLST